MPFEPNTAAAKAFIQAVVSDQHAWDTIVLCTLIQGCFGRTISSREIEEVINARDGRPNAPLVPGVVEHLVSLAKEQREQRPYPMTTRYEKWEEVKERLVARKGKRDYDDEEEMSAWVLYNETLTTANLIASDKMKSSSAGQQRGE